MKENQESQENWHAITHKQAFEFLISSQKGLTQEEAKLRLKKFGPNQIEAKSSENLVVIFFRQLNNPLIYILLASTLLAFLLGKIIDAAVVLSVVILNSLIGFIQEYRSSKSIEALSKMIPNKTTVIRDGKPSSIPSQSVVPGDLVIMQAGDHIAADIRLVSVKNFHCDESALTGESMPVSKRIEPAETQAAIADRKCMAYKGTLVTAGTGTGLVVGTGKQTEFGKISELLEKVTDLETPLSKTLKRFAGWITSVVCFAGAGLFAVGIARGAGIIDAGMASISLAVAAIPEGLPATITIAAAIGVQRMAQRKAIIRHLFAVETLGSTTVICTDKTGTLTQNQMTVQSIWTGKNSYFATGVGYSPEGIIAKHKENKKEKANLEDDLNALLKAVMLCNDASIEQTAGKWSPSGDPTEIALLVVGRKRGFYESDLKKEYPRIDELPFDSEKRIMVTLNKDDRGNKILFLKGAPEAVSRLCDPKLSPAIQENVFSMAKQGMRVIAAAKKEIHSEGDSIREDDIQTGFDFLGLLGMTDPPREEVSDAIKACQEAGVTVKMITGDHPITAGIIGRDLGLQENGEAISGKELNQAEGKQFKEIITQNNVFARALPEHKLKIVKALQADGEVVAMTGDGVNDAPALKQANIGIGMGISGTAVAKEASDMVLADDNFTSIKAAIEEGRRVYDNLIKSISFIFPTSLAQALVILAAILFFPIYENTAMLPISPVQILWVNLIVAVALALPLAFEAMEPDIMQRPPRDPKAPIFSPFVLTRTLIVAALMAAGTIGLFLWEYFMEIKKGIPEDRVLIEAQTMSVTSLIFFQIFYLLNCRSFRFSLFKIGFFSNPYILYGIAFVMIAQLGFIYFPFMNFLFRSSPLSLEAWIVSILVSLSVFPAIAIEKWIAKKISKN